MVVDPGGGNVVTVEALSAVEDDIDRALAQGRKRARERERERHERDGERETA